MTMITLTRDSIKTDIWAFAQRLAEAQHKLSELPATASDVKQDRIGDIADGIAKIVRGE